MYMYMYMYVGMKTSAYDPKSLIFVLHSWCTSYPKHTCTKPTIIIYNCYSSMFLGLSGGAIAGIIVGLVLIAIISIALVVVGVILYIKGTFVLVITIYVHVHCTRACRYV